MPISGIKYGFTSSNVQNAPDRQGVYGLYLGDTIYYGRGTSIRDRLRSHHSGTEGRCTQSANLFNWEETSRPMSREKELLEEYERQHGRLPQCNERVG